MSNKYLALIPELYGSKVSLSDFKPNTLPKIGARVQLHRAKQSQQPLPDC